MSPAAIPDPAPSPDATAPRADNLRGIMWMFFLAVSSTLLAAATKEVGRTLPAAEIAFFRMGIGALLVMPLMLRHGTAGFATRRIGGHFMRAALGIGGFVLSIYAISHMMLANAMALAFSTPLWLVVLSRLLLGERAGWVRAAATLTGFGGIVLIARPDVEITLAAVAAVAGAFLVALAMIELRKLSTTESTLKLIFYLQAFGALFTAPATILQWQSPDAFTWALLIGLGVSGPIPLVCQARAYTIGEPTAIAPVDYSRLPLAVLLGALFFGELPGPVAVTGMIVVVASILVISYNEHRARRRTAAA